MGERNTIIKVEFIKPVFGQKDYYFGSLAAIYESFTPYQIGCKLNTLWRAHIDLTHPHVAKKCIISQQILKRKEQNHASNSQKDK